MRTLTSIICRVSSRSREPARPTSPKPALLTTYCGSAPCVASSAAIVCAAPGFVRSATMTTGRVSGLAVGGFQRLRDDGQRGVRTCGVEARVVLVGLVDAGDEFLVVGRIEAGGVPAGAIDADRLLAHHLEDALVGHGGVAE